MSHPLISRLTDELGWPRLDSAHDLTEFTARPGAHCVFVPGDPARNLETPDVAVILPELRQAFQGAFDCAVASDSIAQAIGEAAGGFKTPNLVFYRAGQVLGAVPKVRDWDDYMARIPQILSLEGAA